MPNVGTNGSSCMGCCAFSRVMRCPLTAGKSTLFNALVGMEKAQAANYPFCTIEPNIASVVMPDPRLEALSKVSHSERCIGIQVEWHDIAGLIAGASQGAGKPQSRIPGYM